MTAADLIRVLLELDQQCLTARPSAWGRAAELVATLCDHAEPSLRDPKAMGDWRSVDLAPARRRAPRELNQPVLDAIQAAQDRPARSLPVQQMLNDASEAWRLYRDPDDVAPISRNLLLGELSCHVRALAAALEHAVEPCRLIVAHYERSDPAKGRGPTLTGCVAKAREALTALGEDF